MFKQYLELFLKTDSKEALVHNCTVSFEPQFNSCFIRVSVWVDVLYVEEFI